MYEVNEAEELKWRFVHALHLELKNKRPYPRLQSLCFKHLLRAKDDGELASEKLSFQVELVKSRALHRTPSAVLSVAVVANVSLA